LEGLEIENLGIFYDHLVILMQFSSYLLWASSIFSRFGMLNQDETGNPGGKKLYACQGNWVQFLINLDQ
jgi:hypothetical protein